MNQLLVLLLLTATPEPFTGRVLDAETNDPLPFTTISLPSRRAGTVANAEGQYVLNLSDITTADTVVFSHVGYESFRISVSDLSKQQAIRLRPAVLNLSEVAIYSRELTVEDILRKIVENFPANYPKPSHRQRIFLHKYEKVPWPKENRIILKNSDFEGLNQALLDELTAKLPSEFVQYQDALVNLYSLNGKHQLVPIEAISLEESSMKDLGKEMEEKMNAIAEEFSADKLEEGTYFKFRTGIFAFDMDTEEESDSTKEEDLWKDSLYYHVSPGSVTSDITGLWAEYAHLDSKNWEFINKPSKYKYELGELTVLNDELVYPLSFSPKWGGLFSGTLYVSPASFAILQLDFAYAPDKSSENIQILGIGHSLRYKRGKVIYEREREGYFVKYIYAEEHESASIDRSFSIMKKQKRFMWDKTLNEFKMDVQLGFDIQSYRELLVMDRVGIDSTAYQAIEQPEHVKFKKEYIYSPEMWENATVIAPTSELKKYTRKE